MRPSIDEYMMSIAEACAARSTCLRRAVGCVLADARGRVLATGYNGVAAGQAHCNEHNPAAHPSEPTFVAYPHACWGAELPAGQDRCEAIHAEANALVWCREPDAVAVAYVTLPPCVACAKLLLGTPCRRIVCRGEHPQAAAARALWEKAGREWAAL